MQLVRCREIWTKHCCLANLGAQNQLLSTLYQYPETKEADVPATLFHERVPTTACVSIAAAAITLQRSTVCLHVLSHRPERCTYPTAKVLWLRRAHVRRATTSSSEPDTRAFFVLLFLMTCPEWRTVLLMLGLVARRRNRGYVIDLAAQPLGGPS